MKDSKQWLSLWCFMKENACRLYHSQQRRELRRLSYPSEEENLEDDLINQKAKREE